MNAAHRPRKRFGQHFLRDPNVLNQIIHAIKPQSNEHFVEIGPGEGVLTELLLPQVKRLDVIEIDRDLAAHLQHRFNHAHLHIHNQDVLTFALDSIGTAADKVRVVGNLPYNISSPLIFKLFTELKYIKDMHFMLQKEVVQRLLAPVGDKHYNRLSVMTQYHCHNSHVLNVPPQAFFPPPKVDSAVVRMVPHPPTLAAKNIDVFANVVKTAFTYRRKTLHNCLKNLIDSEALRAIDIDPNTRPQQLSVDQFVTISNYIYDQNPTGVHP